MTAHLVLVGMMGAGKTTIGRRVANLLGRPFVDADEAFVAKFGQTIGEVFERDGEGAFRAMESKLLHDLLTVAEPMLIAAGGGAVISEANRTLLSKPDVHVVYLHAEPAFLASRAEARPHRPLLADADVETTIGRLFGEREAWYRQVADDIVDISMGSKKDVAAHVAALVTAAG
ncbi:MAG: shikimate kinase [Acidimicrobiales bacterium]